jgi:chromosome partitioning protein
VSDLGWPHAGSQAAEADVAADVTDVSLARESHAKLDSGIQVEVTQPGTIISQGPPVTGTVSRETAEQDGSGESVSVHEPLAASVTETGPDAETHLDAESHLGSESHLDSETPLARAVALDASRRRSLTGRIFPKPDRTRILTVANQKGGVGKTTTAVNIAAGLAQAGLRVLVVDIDPQGNASTALGIDHHADVPSIYDVLVDGKPIDDVVRECTSIPNLWCVPATIDLAGAEIELVSLVARETRMERALTAYLSGAGERGEERMDYVLIDCPPSLGLLTVNAFVAADEVFIPIQCEYYALEGLSQLLKNIELIKSHLNPGLHVSTILLTMYDGRTRLSAQVAEEVRSHFPEQVLRTSVPRSVRISEAPSFGETVMTYDPTSSGALSYLEAAGELAERGVSR